jgi:hypothetical protein
MRYQIRRGVFETNSSSVHSLTICKKSDFDRWKEGEIYLDSYGNSFVSRSIIEAQFKNDGHLLEDENEFDDLCLDYDYLTFEQFHKMEYETFENNYKTESGDEIVAFGYYGYS